MALPYKVETLLDELAKTVKKINKLLDLAIEQEEEKHG